MIWVGLDLANRKIQIKFSLIELACELIQNSLITPELNQRVSRYNFLTGLIFRNDKIWKLLITIKLKARLVKDW